jgi:hypothetical protein
VAYKAGQQKWAPPRVGGTSLTSLELEGRTACPL